MSAKSKRVATAVALFLVFTVTQVYVGVGFAGPNSGNSGIPAAGPQQFTAILTTSGNRPIQVNGASAISGATILTGATIETPDQVGGTINLGALGTIEIAPNTKLTLEFDQNGNVKVTLTTGCVTLHTKKGTTGEVDTSQGKAGSTDKAKASVLNVCFPLGATAPIVSGGAVAGAAAAGGGGLFGLGTAATVAIIGGGAAAVIIPVLATRGNNPSPSTP